jgi:hypothetical protein
MTSEVPPATEVSPSDHAAIPSEAALRRAEAKPPLYRFFRGGLYVAYMVVAVWFCLSITVSVWRAVWGESGRALQVHEQVRHPLQATPAR